MGLRGPGKTPPQLKVLQGTGVPSREVDNLPVEFEQASEVPQPPDKLGEYGVDLWNKIGKQLVNVGLLQEGDIYALTQLAFAWQKFREAMNRNEFPGNTINNALDKGFSHFGMHPAARTKLKASPDGEKKNKFAKFKKK